MNEPPDHNESPEDFLKRQREMLRPDARGQQVEMPKCDSCGAVGTTGPKGKWKCSKCGFNRTTYDPFAEDVNPKLHFQVMPLMNCPECGKKISHSASSCPQCGYKGEVNYGENIATFLICAAIFSAFLWVLTQIGCFDDKYWT